MAGIYIHIPFCKKICSYCDFYKCADIRSIDLFIESLLKEIEYRKIFLDEVVNTIYFGGGTPSVMPVAGVKKIIDKLYENFNVFSDAEITFEMNPEDITFDYLINIKACKINRISIGNQSFDNNILKFLNRRHNSEKSKQAIKNIKMSGFDNFSCDLIYGIPGQTIESFNHDLEVIKQFEVPHLSCYHLTLEEGTYFGKLASQGKLTEIKDKLSKDFYNLLINWSIINGYDQYEVSNFARNNFFSKHNSAYWFNVPYLGLGPSAHSYNGKDRYSNVSNLKQYIQMYTDNHFVLQKDELQEKDYFNEYILLRLRTKWGVDIEEMKYRFNKEWIEVFLRTAIQFEKMRKIRIEGSNISLTKDSLFLSDYIIREFFIV